MMKETAKRIFFSAGFAVVPLIMGILIFNVLGRDSSSNEAGPLPVAEPAVAVAATPKAPVQTNIFVELAKKVVPSVVNISTVTTIRGIQGGDALFREFWDFFFRGQPGPFSPDSQSPQPRPQPKRTALGTGFIIDQEGLILTNNHVVQDADEIKVRFTENPQEKPVDGEVVGRDEELDLALIKVKTDRKLVPIDFGDSDALEVGEYVIAVGNPFGQGHSVVHGIISAKGRDAPDFPLARYLQTDAPINPGNSGGPLVNLRGQVIGINNAIYAGAQGIGFAIPSNLVKDVLPELKTKGRVSRGYIGISIAPLTPEIAEKLGVRRDLEAPFVEQVFPGRAADDAGMKPYDVIVEVDGKKVADPADLIRKITDVAVGEKVKIKVLRGNKSKELTIEVEERPGRDVLAGRSQRSPGKKPGNAKVDVGMDLQTLTPEMARELGLEPDQKGVLVRSLSYNSPAVRAGFMRGDIIVEVDRKAVTSEEDFYSLVKEKKSYLVRVMRVGASGRAFYRVVILDLKSD